MKIKRKRSSGIIATSGVLSFNNPLKDYSMLSQSVGVIKKRRSARAVQTISSLVEPAEEFMNKSKLKDLVTPEPEIAG
jgi:hypothetical protein